MDHLIVNVNDGTTKRGIAVMIGVIVAKGIETVGVMIEEIDVIGIVRVEMTGVNEVIDIGIVIGTEVNGRVVGMVGMSLVGTDVMNRSVVKNEVIDHVIHPGTNPVTQKLM